MSNAPTADQPPAEGSGAPIVGGRWFFRLILFLALITLAFAPLAFMFPGPRPMDRFLQTLLTAVGFLAATGFAWRDRRPLAVVTAAITLLGGSIVSAYLAPPFAAEAVGITVIAAVLILPATTRRFMLPVLTAVGVAGIAAVAVSRLNYVTPTASVGGAVVSAAAVIFVALAFVGWTHVRLVNVVERARRTSATLDESEQRFRSVFTSSPNAILVVDPAGRIVDASDRAAVVFGCSTEVLRTMAVEAFIPAAQRASHVEQRAAFNSVPADRMVGAHPQLSALRADGTPFPAEIGLSWFDTDEGRFATVVVADVTARRRIEDAAREATETIRAIFDASPAGMTVTALDGTVRLWNQAMTRLTGIKDVDAIGRLDPSVPDEGEAAQARIRRSVARNETVTAAEMVVRGPHASTKPAVGSFGPLHDASGRVVGIVGVIEDVTNMRSLEAQVNRKARLESVGQLAGGIAHDINNVLTAIGGFAALSLEDLDNGLPVDRETIATIAEGAARTGALTRQLLAFARRDVRPAETIVLGAAVRAVEPMLRGLIGEHIALTMSTTDEGHVRIARSQVEQLVLNLVVNARDALVHGGTIQVQVANLTISDEEISSHVGAPSGEYIGLTVIDNGTGMSPAVVERIFDPFFTTKGPDEGTGLGLSTVHGIVTAAGGHVWVSSEEGAGTTFLIVLPQTEDVVDEPHTPAPAADFGHETILVVEDEDLVRALACRVLERAGFRVLAAPNAIAALHLSADHDGPIDLLMTDVIMPVMLGPELALRITQQRPGIRVLFASGFTAGGTGLSTTLPPDARFIDKPFSPAALVAAARAAIDDVSLPLAG